MGMEIKFKPGSFRGKAAEVTDTSRFAKFDNVPFPDPDRRALTTWTYRDIKREVAEFMESLSDLGYKFKECTDFTIRTFQIAIWNDPLCKQFTENLLVVTAVMRYLADKGSGYLDGDLGEIYNAMLSEWTADHYKGYRLSVEDENELEEDIALLMKKFERVTEAVHNDFKMMIHDFLTEADPEIWRPNLGHNNQMRYFTPPGYLEAIQGSLSEDAFLLITRFDRDYYNPNRYKFFLEANGMRMTPEVQRYFDLYDGRSFIYRDASFYINHHCGLNRIKGYTTGKNVGAIVMNNYYLLILNKLTRPEEGVYIDMYGRIHEYANGYIRFAANTFEEYLELSARKQARAWLMINKRRELEDKYFIPEIRLLSMKRLRRGVYV